MDVKDVKDRGLMYNDCEGIIKLIRSRNEDDLRVALTIIENNFSKDDLLPILFYWKHANQNQKQIWHQEFKRSCGAAEDAVNQYGGTLYMIAKHIPSMSDEDRAFTESNMNHFMLKVLRTYGFDFIEEIKITLKK